MIKLAVPHLDESEFEEIKKVLDSKYLVQGSKVNELEQLMSEYLGVKHAVAVSSGTAALHLALLALEIRNGDEVIAPDFTFPATTNAVEVAGGNVKLVDIKKEDFCINEDLIEENITEKTKAIMVVQEFGNCADMDKIISIAEKYNLKVIEDAACALGAEYKNKKVGTIGDIGCFSLHPRKAITTGEGGIIVTNDDTLAERVRIIRNHGLNYVDGKPLFVDAGLNYRMTDIQGAMGVAQFKKLNMLNESRENIALMYNDYLKDIKNITLPTSISDVKHIWQTYHILLNNNIDRDEVIKKLRENGIETNFGAYSVHMQPYYKEKYNLEDDKFINSKESYLSGIALPLHFELKEEDIKYIKETLERVLNELCN